MLERKELLHGQRPVLYATFLFVVLHGAHTGTLRADTYQYYDEKRKIVRNINIF